MAKESFSIHQRVMWRNRVGQIFKIYGKLYADLPVSYGIRMEDTGATLLAYEDELVSVTG